MSCGCDNSGAGNAPLLAGNLDPAFSPSAPAPAVNQESFLADVTGGATPFSSAWFAKAGLVLVFVIGALWVADNALKEKKE